MLHNLASNLAIPFPDKGPQITEQALLDSVH